VGSLLDEGELEGFADVLGEIGDGTVVAGKHHPEFSFLALLGFLRGEGASHLCGPHLFI